METYFDFILVARKLKSILGEPDPGTRMYRAYGDEDAFDLWFDAVCKVCEPDGTVSPGGVSMYARVSRAGVHKRLKEGKLTAFLFHFTKPVKLLLGREQLKRERPVILIPVSECRAWARFLKGLGEDSHADEAVGDGDYEGSFLAEVPKDWRRKRIQKERGRKRSK